MAVCDVNESDKLVSDFEVEKHLFKTLNEMRKSTWKCAVPNDDKRQLLKTNLFGVLLLQQVSNLQSLISLGASLHVVYNLDKEVSTIQGLQLITLCWNFLALFNLVCPSEVSVIEGTHYEKFHCTDLKYFAQAN